MELGEYIATTLTQIISGVSTAMDTLENAEVGDRKRAFINPASEDSIYAPAQDISFEIAVTLEENGKKGGGAKLSVLGASIGIDGKTEVSNRAINKINFSIPVSLPSVPTRKFQKRVI